MREPLTSDLPHLRARLLQLDLAWEDVDANLAHVRAAAPAPGTQDLVVLPEMFTTGFTMRGEALAGEAGARGLAFLRAEAERTGACFCGSTPAHNSDARPVNRMLFVPPDPAAPIVTYDKRHRYAPAGEHEAYAPGHGAPVTVDHAGWRILLQVCYDLRFPVYSRNVQGYHLALYVASWPEARRLHWLTLLRARAIENQCFVLGVNRAGTDGNGLTYAGDTVAYGPMGEELGALGEGPGRLDVSLERAAVDEVRTRLPFGRDADRFTLGT